MDIDYRLMEISMMEEASIENFNEDTSLYSLVESVKATIDKLIIKMKSYIKKLQADVEILMDKKSYKLQLKKLEAELKNPTERRKKIEFANMGGAIDVYRHGIGKLMKMLDNILKKDYKEYRSNEMKNIDAKIEEFNYELDKLDEEIDATLEDKIVLKRNEALEYVRDLRTGRNIIYKYYFDTIHKYEKFKIDAESKLKMKEKDASISFELVQKQKSVLSKLSAKLSKITRKIIIKTAMIFG